MPYRVRYPYGLLTENFGILKESDLISDALRGLPHPYEEHGFNGGYPFWQCFLNKDVSIQYEKWRDSDPMGRSNVMVDLCSVEFKVKTENEIHVYVGRRAQLDENCRDLIKKWRKITINNAYVCFNGYGGEIEPRKNYIERRNQKIWTWDRIKTKSGCMSYFDSYCDISFFSDFHK